MINAIESKQYSPLNIIGCRDGKNDQKSHSKTDFEIQDNVNNKFDVSIEEIEQKTLNIMKCLDGENDQKSSHLSLNIIECIDGENDQKSLHSQAYLKFQNYVDNQFDVSIEEIEPKINKSYILFVEQQQILKRSIIKYKPVSLKKPGLMNNYTHDYTRLVSDCAKLTITWLKLIRKHVRFKREEYNSLESHSTREKNIFG